MYINVCSLQFLSVTRSWQYLIVTNSMTHRNTVTHQNPNWSNTSRNKHSDEQYDHAQQIFTNSMSNLNILIMSSEYTHMPELRMAKYVSVHTFGQYMWCAARACTPPENARTLLQAAPVVSEHSCVCVCARICVCACVSVWVCVCMRVRVW